MPFKDTTCPWKRRAKLEYYVMEQQKNVNNIDSAIQEQEPCYDSIVTSDDKEKQMPGYWNCRRNYSIKPKLLKQKSPTQKARRKQK